MSKGQRQHDQLNCIVLETKDNLFVIPYFCLSHLATLQAPVGGSFSYSNLVKCIAEM